MKIISITSTTSDAGKTTLASLILKHFKNLAAIKVTTCDHGKADSRCPRGLPCGVSLGFGCEFRIVSDPVVILEHDKDTALFSSSGANRVLWLISRTMGLKAGLNRALKLIRGEVGVVVEGNHPAGIINSDLTIMLIDPSKREMKSSAREILGKVDIFVINERKGNPLLNSGFDIIGDSLNGRELFMFDICKSCSHGALQFLRSIEERLFLRAPSIFLSKGLF